jgi:hypothetical protein
VAFVMNSLHIDWLRVRGLAARLLLVAALLATVIPHARGEVLGNWDFSGGSLAALTGPATLSELSTKPYYPAFGGQPGIPAAEFGSPASFGITGPGGLEKTVLRVPNTAGYGPMGGLIAEFPRRINATATSLNRYTLVMDVLVRQAAYDEVFARGTRHYVSLFQTAPLSDGDLFIDVRDQAGLPGADRPLGIGGVYGGDVVADTWHRVALVATLDAPESEPRLTAYVDGQPASTLIWDDLLAAGLASNDSVKLDLVDSTMPSGALQTDGRFSIATLGQISGGQLPDDQTSAFFLFNDNQDEVGEVFVAHLQFRDEPLSASAIESLGGVTGEPISVPEPASLGLAAALAALLARAAFLRRGRRHPAAPEWHGSRLPQRGW